MTDLNNDQRMDNQLYYEEIIKYLNDPTQSTKSNTDLNWIKIQSINYFVSEKVPI